MASIINTLSYGYNYLFVELADPRASAYPLMDIPLLSACILGFYHYFIFKLGPRIMQNRPPFDLERVLVVFNLVQIIACFYLVVQGVRYTLFKYNFFCEPIDYSSSEFALEVVRHTYIYFLLKVLDLGDTIFFVLRKKNNQITFLHVYHHTGMALLGWAVVKFLAGGHGIFVGILNSFVHVVMYFYYLLSAWDKKYKNNVWWKKHITQLQIVQFFILSMYFIQLLFQPNCKYPKFTVWMFVPQNIIMIILFTDFYIKQYMKPEKKLKNQSTKSINNGKKQDLDDRKEA
ncbi:hypothetical protein ILUMI_05046 [Ignelater luminosus]|uniref:Elongation of very long chain fatty acids protein n=1 Tax=Ignelater luminosus TaxID=2038154 RepID=A0A8K0GDY8_IGNLU|nr:hypothetical protein ILUMI_05046 [Ignelater luminosus]